MSVRLAVSAEGTLVAYDRDDARLTWFEDEPRVVPITAALSGTDIDGDPELVAIGPGDVAYFLTWAPNELVAASNPLSPLSRLEITRREWTRVRPTGVLRHLPSPTTSGTGRHSVHVRQRSVHRRVRVAVAGRSHW